MKRFRFQCPACFRQVQVFDPEFFRTTAQGNEYKCACFYCKSKVTLIEQPIDYVQSILLHKEIDVNLN